MPLPLLAAAAANAATLFSYNRQNFMYNKGQEVNRQFTGLNYKLQQFQLYRQDIRDLVALTTVRMTHYHVVGALELGMCATLLGPARLPNEVPEWVLWHQLVALCAAFAYLVASMWFATRATVAAESFNVRLQTQWIRLPLPDDEALDGVLTKAEDFEVEGMKDMLRVPFLTSAFRRAFRSTADAAANEEAEAEASPGAANTEASPRTGDGEGRSGQTLAGCRANSQVSMSSLSALQLYQQLQRNWSCFDAYSRVCMSVGTYWLVLSLAYYEIGYTLCTLGKPMPAIASAGILTGVLVLLVYVDLFAGRAKLLASTVLLFTGPLCVALGALLEPEGSVETPGWSVVAGLAHVALTGWLWREGSIVPGKADLPIRFRGVVYLDIFGPIVRQLRSYLDSTGLGQHAMTDFSDSDEEELPPDSREDKRAQAELGGLASEEVFVQLSPGDTGASRMQEVAASRSKLQAALSLEGSSSQRRRLLNEALHDAELAGIGPADAQVRKAQCLLAKVSFPSDVRRMRRLLHDWRDGAVGRYLDEAQRKELWRMCEDVDILYARLKLRPLEAPGIPRSISLDTAGSAGFTPAWTRISHDTSGYGDENDAYEYWVGTARGTEGGNCFAGAPPAGVRCEEFEDVRARCADLLARSEYFACEAAAKRSNEKSGGCLEGVLASKGHDHERTHGNRHRKGHQPVVSYRVMCIWLLVTWIVGVVVHFAQLRPVRALLAGQGREERRLLDRGGRAGDAPRLPRAALPRPELFFKPRSLQCLEAPTLQPQQQQPGLVASNGFLVYSIGAEGHSVEAGLELYCPVAAHDSLVSANCSVAGHCQAVVAARGGLWHCSSVANEASSTEPLASLPQAFVRGTRARPRLWAASDAELGTFFAAPLSGPIVQLRRSGTTLRVVAELQPPAEGPEVVEWLLLSVQRGGILLALASPGPNLLSWSLSSGKFLGSRPLSSPARAGGWCATSAGNLFRLEDDVEGLELQWASWAGL